MSSTALITQALADVLKPATPVGEAVLEAHLLAGVTRALVENAVQAGWPEHGVEIVWSVDRSLARARAYVSDAEGSRLAGTVTVGGSSDRYNAIVSTDRGGVAGMKLPRHVLQAVLA